MALFEKKTIIDGNGKETSIENGIFSKVKMESNDNITCLTKQDIFGLTEDKTCITTSNTNTIINNNNNNK